VYKCSGWESTNRGEPRRFFVDSDGVRTSHYANGAMRTLSLTVGGTTRVHRWEHWICERGEAAKWMERNGWHRQEIPGKTWKNGQQAHKWVQSSCT